MMISLHMPKCGGTSFMELLRSHYKLRFSKDNDYPIHQTAEQRRLQAKKARRRIQFKYQKLFAYRFNKCIHGHFLPYKYLDFCKNEDHIFVTWLRDPINRLVSHYYYWRRIYPEMYRPKPLHKKVVEENWSLREFAFSEEMQNLYAAFLWKFPLERFDFIGLTEHFDEDLHYFARRYLHENSVITPQINRGPKKTMPAFADKKVVEDLKAFHARDYEIYNYALKRRRARAIK